MYCDYDGEVLDIPDLCQAHVKVSLKMRNLTQNVIVLLNIGNIKRITIEISG